MPRGKVVKVFRKLPSRVRTAYLDWCFQFQEDRLVDEDLSSLRAKILDLMFLELNGLARSISAHCSSANQGSMGDDRRVPQQ